VAQRFTAAISDKRPVFSAGISRWGWLPGAQRVFRHFV